VMITIWINDYIVVMVYEGPEKATRVGVNESQSKFLVGTWPIS
jgi:hypothetical protein